MSDTDATSIRYAEAAMAKVSAARAVVRITAEDLNGDLEPFPSVYRLVTDAEQLLNEACRRMRVNRCATLKAWNAWPGQDQD